MRSFILSALKKISQLSAKRYSISSMWFVNRDALPLHLHSWLVTLLDQVIITEGKLNEDGFVENIAILKNNSKEFTPRVFQRVVSVEPCLKKLC